MISVIIPLYNASRFIEETLASVQSQTYTDWECIVVDDGSVDNSAEVVKRIAQSDSRIRYAFQTNAGPSAARNRGLRLAHGEYIQFLDADDWFPPERFATMLEAYADVQDNVVLYSSLAVAAENDIHQTSCYTKKTQVGDIDFRRMYGGFGREFAFIPGAVLFPRKALDTVAWNESLRASEDWDYYLQLCKQGYIFRNVPRNLFVYRAVEGSLSNAIGKVYKANYDIVQHYFRPSLFLEASKHITGTFYRNLLDIKHHRMRRIVLPAFSCLMCCCFLVMPFTILKYYIELNND